MLFHSYPVSFYKELLQAFPFCAIIDLTPGERALAQAALEQNAIYLGITFNPKHT